jgi:hypothetical protein
MRTLIEDPIIIEGMEGRKYKSNRLYCPCGSGTFRIYRHEGQAHGHFACVHCDAVWCGTFSDKPCDHSEVVPADN